MFPDSEPDYSSYSRRELHDVKRKIDRKAHPERYRRLLSELDKRKEEPKKEYEEYVGELRKIEKSTGCETFRVRTRKVLYQAFYYPVIVLLIFGVLDYFAPPEGLVFVVPSLVCGVIFVFHYLILWRFYFLNRNLILEVSVKD